MPVGVYERKRRDPAERFWEKVDKTDDHWLWTGSTAANGGYGTFYLGDKRYVGAHRFAYESERGPIPPGQTLDHRPDCPKHCCNPAHLRVVPHRQNAENHAGPRANSRSGVRGVYWDKARERWMAQVTQSGKVVYSQRFDSLDDAKAAVIAARNQFHTHNDLDR